MYKLLTPQEMMIQLLTRSCLSSHDLVTKPQDVPVNLRNNRFDNQAKVVLGESKPLLGDLYIGLRERISHRNFSDRPVSLNDVRGLLDEATRMDETNWFSERTAGVNTDLWLVAQKVSGIESGIYRYTPNVLECVAITRPVGDILGEIILQEEFTHAPAIIIVTGNLAASLSHHRSHGYRQLLIRGGAMLNAAYLTGLRLGLVGCIFAGLIAEPLRRYLGMDGYLETPLGALAIGHSVPQSEPL